MAELFGIMSLLDAEEFGDEDAFLERYGGGRSNPMPDPEQVHALQVRPPRLSYKAHIYNPMNCGCE